MIELKRATPEAVRFACMNFHYAKRVPQAKWAYNVYEDGEWCGVVVFGFGAQHNIATGIGYDYGEVCELERVALNGKQKFTSQVVSECLKRLHHDAKQIKDVVSYADANQNHLGIIYQATNWIYIGDTAKTSGSKPDAYLIHGKKMHPRSVGARGYRQSISWLRENVDPNAKEIWGKPKFKYIFVFDKKQRKAWQQKALPYPKKNQGGDTH